MSADFPHEILSNWSFVTWLWLGIRRRRFTGRIGGRHRADSASVLHTLSDLGLLGDNEGGIDFGADIVDVRLERGAIKPLLHSPKTLGSAIHGR